MLNRISSIFWLNGIPLCMYNYIFLMYPSAGGHVGWFDFLAIVNSAMELQMLLHADFISFGYIPNSGIAGL
jgi:hypothetical protein